VRILLLAHSFNSLTQRLYAELLRKAHEVSVEFDIHDDVTVEAVERYRPGLILAPFLKRAIPESIWKAHTCLVLHPGIRGDRGPSALDWAILEAEPEWGVTVLQADAEMDAGPIWASRSFPLPPAKKSSVYRSEVTEAGVAALREAVEKFAGGGFVPEPLDPALSRWRPLMPQEARAIDWSRDDTAAVLRKIRAADGFPGVLDELLGEPVLLFDAHPEGGLKGAPGAILGQRRGALCLGTVDGAVWVTHLKQKAADSFKLPAAKVLEAKLAGVPELPEHDGLTWRDIRYEEANGVGYLHFDFYNGAMGTEHCNRLREAFDQASRCPIRVLVLMGGADFWSNGIHLNLIEADPNPADESWRNINAMNDLARAIITNGRQLTISALQGNAGAGGVFLSLAADRVYARQGVVLNPHYKGMGNLYGSEYWTYLLPRRVGEERARTLTQNRLPVLAEEAVEWGLLDGCFGGEREAFVAEIRQRAEALAAAPDFDAQLAEKNRRRAEDEAAKPLAAYREEEMAHMKLNFYGFDPSYHVARSNFVRKVPRSRTPLYLARHRA